MRLSVSLIAAAKVNRVGQGPTPYAACLMGGSGVGVRAHGWWAMTCSAGVMQGLSPDGHEVFSPLPAGKGFRLWLDLKGMQTAPGVRKS